MKRFTSSEWIWLMLAGSVCVVLVVSVIGIAFKGSAEPTEGAVVVRTALIDLPKVIVGGIIGVASLPKSGKSDTPE